MQVQVLGLEGLYEFRLWGGFAFKRDVWALEGSRSGLWVGVCGGWEVCLNYSTSLVAFVRGLEFGNMLAGSLNAN